MMTSEPVTNDFWSMRSDEAGTKPSENYVVLVGSICDLTDHRDRNVGVGWLLVGVALVHPNTGVVATESEKNRLVSSVVVV